MDPILEELRERLINVEHKINRLLGEGIWNGHADQAFGHLTYAQHGEDMVIMNIFHLLGIAAPSYLDIGAHHPLNISNTALLYQRGSRGVNVEANPDLIEAFRQVRPADVNLNVGVGCKPGVLPFYRIDNWSGRNSFDEAAVQAFVASHPQFKINDAINVEVTTVEAIIREHFAARALNFVTIDVEGLDLEIMAAFPFALSRPEVICAEFISGNNTSIEGEMSALLAAAGYRPYFKTIGNIIYLDDAIRARVVP